jgi:LPLT family lysophospholipid transporter-like MFS transporter
MPRTFYLVLVVQFISTLADNALLIVSIARVIELGSPAWIIPVIKISFTVFYVVLAPLAGPLADAFPKGRVMLGANFLKLCAIAWMLTGADPAVAIAVAGLGAAIYAPAKYGLITELLPPHDLVRANGFFESVTVSAVIFGTALGGLLISPWMPLWVLPDWLMSTGDAASSLVAGMIILVAMNAVATVLSLWVGDSGARYEKHSVQPNALVWRFHRENLILWRDPMGGLSMTVTTLLWGVGATLQLMVLRWANEALGLTLAQAAYLQGVTALGVVAGAILASRWISLGQAATLLPVGILIGVLIPSMLLIESVTLAVVLLITVGTLAGFFVVPMNALLQHRGCQLMTAGRSIAVQGFNENGGMLLMLGLYAVATALDASLFALVMAFGCLVTLGMTLIYRTHQGRTRRESLARVLDKVPLGQHQNVIKPSQNRYF